MKQKNREKKLSARIADYTLSMREKNAASTKIELRKANGGYHLPGSTKK